MAPGTSSEKPRQGLALGGPDPERIVEYAVAAEEAGWDGVFHIDHLVDYTASEPEEHGALNDPWIMWAGVATRTERITLGTSITPVPRRHPWQLAKDLVTLDRLSNGRVLLGAGLGAPWEFQTFGTEYDQKELARQYDEALEVITGLWSGEPFSYDGDYYTVDEAVMRPRPVQEPRIPIVIGGWWPFKKPFQRGARWDGILPNWPSMHHGATYEDAIPDHMREVIPDEPSHDEEVREMLEYYHGITDDPGEVVMLVTRPSLPPDFAETCRELGATWLIHSRLDGDLDPDENLERIREGPPE